MKKTVIIFALLVLSGCTNKYSEADFPARPPELSDCKFFKMSNSSGEKIMVVRCPNSTTSTTERVGKHDQTNVVFDGGTEPLKQ